jgi:catechol 2,3-dioxygenase-like lactoylglutathione lyase family enzyme
MKDNIMYLIPLFALISYSQINTDNNIFTEKRNNQSLKNTDMKLGAFSISLSVKDLEKSKSFYQNLGFEILAGAMDKNYLIMKNENSLIGLFQGMFEGNILTFNPGWDEDAKEVNSFDDVRKIQQHLKSQEINLESEVDESTTGPASFMVKDPDGNLILIDQHR